MSCGPVVRPCLAGTNCSIDIFETQCPGIVMYPSCGKFVYDDGYDFVIVPRDYCPVQNPINVSFDSRTIDRKTCSIMH